MKSLSRTEIEVLTLQATIGARRLARTVRLPACDVPDVSQDLLVDLLARLKWFDPEKGSLGAFATTVFANRRSRLAHDARTEQRVFGAIHLSLDDELPEGGTRGDLIAEEDGYAAFMGQPTTSFAQVEQCVDLDRSLSGLRDDELLLLAGLLNGTAVEVSADLGISRASLYRLLEGIRLHALMAGLQADLGMPATGEVRA